MLVLMSPAKTQNFTNEWKSLCATTPKFLDKWQILVDVLKEKSPAELGKLLKISPKLATINAERMKYWQKIHTGIESKPAVLAYAGEGFVQVGANKFGLMEQKFAQKILRIASGMYGLLRPYDLIQPYRLEMKTKVEADGCDNLYDFWKEPMSEYVKRWKAKTKNPILVNLASNDYSKAIPTKDLRISMVKVEFVEESKSGMKVVGLRAKKARGMMVNFIITNKIETVEGIKRFGEGGYKLLDESFDKLVFVRKT